VAAGVSRSGERWAALPAGWPARHAYVLDYAV
jgi:hypothetical protein